MNPRSFQRLMVSLLSAGMLAALTGCGSGLSTIEPVVSTAASKECIGCHATNSRSISSTSGVRITEQWQLSAHNTAHGAGCLDCHSYAHYHDNVTSCRSCHATAHSNNGTSCSLCHGASSKEAANCISCHAAPHKNQASCSRCHGGSMPVDVALKNPDAAGKCFGCHNGGKNFKRYTAVGLNHFNNFTGSGFHPAMYVTINYQNSCTSCHEPHNPLKGKGAAERKAWASSGHGDVNGLAWASRDFKKSVDCIRCHTATGFINFTDSNYALPSTTWATAGDIGREVLTCKACHVNDSFAVRHTPAFSAPYNSNLNHKHFPDEGESNLCVACHSGRESADSIEAIPDFSNASFKNSHYMAAAGLMFMAVGFDNYTRATTAIGTTTYQKTMTPDDVTVPTFGISGGVSSTHRKLGTVLITGDSHNKPFFLPGVLDSNGPCVTCHLNANGVARRPATGHTWLIDVNAVAQVCINCHAAEVAVAGVADATALNTFLEEQAAVFTDALGIIQQLLLTKYSIKYDPSSYPYFYDLQLDSTGKTAVKDWTRSALRGGVKDQVFGKRLMGSAYNLNLLVRETGAYAHARTYVRRLVYDTIDWLDNNKLDFSTSATAIAYNSTLYGKGAKAYTTSATVGDLAPGTTLEMIYLISYNRSTGAWTLPERP